RRFARARRSSSDSRFAGAQRVRDAQHVLGVLRVPEEPRVVVAALVIAKVDYDVTHDLRYAEVPVRVIDRRRLDLDMAKRASDLEIAAQRLRERQLLTQRRAPDAVVLIGVARRVIDAIAPADGRAELVPVVRDCGGRVKVTPEQRGPRPVPAALVIAAVDL